MHALVNEQGAQDGQKQWDTDFDNARVAQVRMKGGCKGGSTYERQHGNRDTDGRHDCGRPAADLDRPQPREVTLPLDGAEFTSLDEGDGWVNWSGLATLLSDLALAARRSVDSLLPV